MRYNMHSSSILSCILRHNSILGPRSFDRVLRPPVLRMGVGWNGMRSEIWGWGAWGSMIDDKIGVGVNYGGDSHDRGRMRPEFNGMWGWEWEWELG